MRYTPKGIYYLNSTADFAQYRNQLKFIPCPHCRAVGFLICHGYLRGYGQTGSDKIIRGQRFFCSNRDRRAGCGRTYSVLFAGFLYRHTIPASALWKFIQGVRRGLNRKHAWEKLGLPFTIQTAYRLWNTFLKHQSSIRSHLISKRPPPNTNAPIPIFQLIEHLASAFPHASCPIAAFQAHFQRSFLH